jgi:hypothetical protein
MPPISRWPRIAWRWLRTRASAILRRLRAGWADPGPRRRAANMLAAAAAIFWVSAALLIAGGPGARIVAGLGLVVAGLYAGAALLILWGRDL